MKLSQRLSDYIQHHKGRMFAGFLLLVTELFLFFGAGNVLREDEIHFLSGEGSWDVALSESAPVLCQEFVPQYQELKSVSFRMVLSDMETLDGLVTVSIEDSSHEKLFEETKSFSEITDSAFTDVEVNLRLHRKDTYYLKIAAAPSSQGEYPLLSVCSTDYRLPESRSLIQDKELPG